jgi:hypothetical protein
MADPLRGWEPGDTYGAYQSSEQTSAALKKQVATEKKKKAKKPSTDSKPTSTSSKTPAPAAKPKANPETFNPAQVVGEALSPIGKAIQAPFDALSEGMTALNTSILGPEEMARRAKVRQGVKAGKVNPLTGKAYAPGVAEEYRASQEGTAELGRIVAKATGPGIIEKVIDTAVPLLDAAAVPIRAATGTYDATRDPFKVDRYVRAETDFGITPKTEGGKIAARLLSYVNISRAATRFALGGIAKATGKAQKLSQLLKVPKGKGAQTIVDNIPGAIGDFILASPSEDPETLSNFAQNLVPEEYRGLFMLAVDVENDNIFQLKAKGGLDGLGLGAVTDTIGSLFKAKWAAKAAKNAGKSDEAALEAGAKTLLEESDRAAAQADADYAKEGANWQDTREVQLNKLLERENVLRNQKAKVDPTDPFADTLNKQIDDELEKNLLDQREIDRAILDDTPKEPWEKEASFRKPNIPESVVAGRSWLTDAALKRLNVEDTWTNFVQPAVKGLDPEKLNEVYRSLGAPAWKQVRGEHLKTLTNAFLDVMDSAQTADEAKNMAMDYLRTQGETYAKKSGEMVEDTSVIVVQSALQGLSGELATIATSLLKHDIDHVTGGNQLDRMLDRWLGLMMLRKEAITLDAGRRLALLKHPTASRLYSEETIDGAKSLVLTPKAAMQWASDIKHDIRSGKPEAIEEIRRLALAFQLAGGDPEKALSFGSTIVGGVAKESLGLFFNSILSGPKTIARNMGSLIRVFAQPMEIGIKGIQDGDDRLISAAGAGMIGAWAGIRDAFHVAAVTAKSGVPATWNALNVVQKAESMAQVDAVVDAAVTGTEKVAAGAYKAVHALNNWTNQSGRILMSTDDFVRTIVVRQKIYEDATIKAFEIMSTGSTSFAKAQQAAIEDMEKNVDFKTGQIKDEALQKYAETATYQNDPGGFINHLSAAVDKFEPLGLPVGRYMFPFVRTPANIMAYQLQHTPMIGKFFGDYKNAIQANDTLKIAEYQGREAVGSFLVAFGYTHAWSGHITGNMPMDKDEKERWRQAGIQPRSAKVAGQWISYNWFEPLSNWIAAAADLGHMERNGSIKELDKVAEQLTFAIAASFTQKSMLANLDDLGMFLNPVDSVADFTKEKQRFGEPTGAMDRLSSSVLSGINGFLPYSGFRKAWARSSDKYYREYENWTQKTLSEMQPWLSKNHIPYDLSIISGKAILNPGGGYYNSVSPFEATSVNTDKVAQKLVDLKVWPTIDYKKTKDGLNLTSQQRIRLKELMHDGGRLPTELSNWFNSADFKNSEANWKARTLEAGEVYVEPEHIRTTKQIFSSFYNQATAQLINENPEIEEKLRSIGQLKFAQGSGDYSKLSEVKAKLQKEEDAYIQQLLDFNNPQKTN